MTSINLPAGDAPGNVTIVQHATIQPPRPVGLSKKNSLDLFGVEPEALPKFLRRLGVPATMTPSGPVALVADVEAAMRANGRPLEARRRVARVEDDVEDADDDEALLAAAGVHLRPAAGRP